MSGTADTEAAEADPEEGLDGARVLGGLVLPVFLPFMTWLRMRLRASQSTTELSMNWNDIVCACARAHMDVCACVCVCACLCVGGCCVEG